MNPFNIDSSVNIHALAFIFDALRLGFAELQEWYTASGVFSGIPLRGLKPAEVMRTPSPHLFLDSSGKKVRFGYRHRMSSSNLHIWKGDHHSSDWPNNADSFVVKFTHSYGEEAHRLLAEAGHAPKLFYCGPPYALYPDLDVYRPIMDFFWHQQNVRTCETPENHLKALEASDPVPSSRSQCHWQQLDQ